MIRFLADSNVGRLARWLRAYGYDAAYAPHVDDSLLIGRALAEGRVLLTRDADLMQRRVVSRGSLRALLLRSDRFDEQLRQVVEELELPGDRALSRCLECNGLLKNVEKKDISKQLAAEPRTLLYYNAFRLCSKCGRTFWPGSHFANLAQRVDRFVGS